MTDDELPPNVTDELLDQVLIGGREHATVTIVDYDPAWPQRFEQERVRISDALGAIAQRIEHVGSTSVPGLAAKPIIDILVVVDAAAIECDAQLRAALEATGYVLRVREPEHRMFRTPERDVQVHVWASNSEEIERYFLLRDRLRRSTEDREAYAATKRALALRNWTDMNYYAEAKSPIIQAILAHARDDRERGVGETSR